MKPDAIMHPVTMAKITASLVAKRVLPGMPPALNIGSKAMDPTANEITAVTTSSLPTVVLAINDPTTRTHKTVAEMM